MATGGNSSVHLEDITLKSDRFSMSLQVINYGFNIIHNCRDSVVLQIHSIRELVRRKLKELEVIH